MSGKSAEKKRLEQFLLQSRATFIPDQIDTIRLRAAQIEAGKKPVSEKVVKQQQKKKKKARRGKQLRGEVSRAIREQKRFERGERRDKPEEEPRIIGEPRNTGLSYDPDIERRRLDIMEQQIRDSNFRALADRRAAANRQEQELAVRRGELAAGRAERRLERERLAAVPPPPPIVIPPAPAPDIRVEAPRIQGPLVAGPLVADPIPEITRLSRQIRADYNAFGQEQRERNEDVLRQIREQTEAQQAQSADIRQRQLQTDETIRQAIQRQDAVNQEVQERIGLGEVAMGEARDAVVQEIRDAEGRLRQASRELDTPGNYDEVILRAVDEAVQQGLQEGTPEVFRRNIPIEEVDSPTPRPDPQEPAGIAGVIAGGGELDLPNVVVERPGSIEAGPDESLRLSPEQQARVYPPGTGGGGQARGPGGALRPAPRSPETVRPAVNPREEQLSDEGSLDPFGSGAERELRRFGVEEGTTTDESETASSGTQESQEGLQFTLEDVEPVNVAEALRLSRLAIEETEPVLRLEEADEAEQARLRLTDTQDFLQGFEAPQELQAAREQRAEVGLASPRSPLPPILGGAAEADVALQQLLDQPAPGTPQRAGGETPSTPQEEAILEELRAVDVEPLQPVAQGIAQFGGATQPAQAARVIEDAGVVAQQEPRGEPSAGRQLRPLDPDVLLEAVEEAEEVGQVQDNRPQVVRDSSTLYGDVIPDLATGIRQGPQGARGQRGGVGYRIRNNTDRTLKKIKPGDVVDITGVEAGARGEGRFRLDTQTAAGTRISLDEFGPLVDDGSFLFERGNRHELGGHFDENPYGPPPPQAEQQGEPGLLQQGAEVVGEAVAAGAGGAARFVGGVAQGVGEGLYEQLAGAGDVGAALGRGAVAGIAGAGRLVGGVAQGAAGAVLGGGEEEQAEAEPEP